MSKITIAQLGADDGGAKCKMGDLSGPKKARMLTPTSEKLISAFDIAARHWGYEQDQGYGAAYNKSEKEYLSADAALKSHVNALERKVRRLKDELRKAMEGTTPKHLRGKA